MKFEYVKYYTLNFEFAKFQTANSLTGYMLCVLCATFLLCVLAHVLIIFMKIKMRLLVIDCGRESACETVEDGEGGESERGRKRGHMCVASCGTLFLETCAHCHFEQCSSRQRWGNLSRSLSRFRQEFARHSLWWAWTGAGAEAGVVCSGLGWVFGWVKRVSYLPVSQLLNLILQLTAVCLNGRMDSHTCLPLPPSFSYLASRGLWLRRSNWRRFNRAAETAVCLNWY